MQKELSVRGQPPGVAGLQIPLSLMGVGVRQHLDGHRFTTPALFDRVFHAVQKCFSTTAYFKVSSYLVSVFQQFKLHQLFTAIPVLGVPWQDITISGIHLYLTMQQGQEVTDICLVFIFQ